MNDKVNLKIVHGVTGDCLYIDGENRIGPKPWGGGETIFEIDISRKELQDALGVTDLRDKLFRSAKEQNRLVSAFIALMERHGIDGATAEGELLDAISEQEKEEPPERMDEGLRVSIIEVLSKSCTECARYGRPFVESKGFCDKEGRLVYGSGSCEHWESRDQPED